MAILVPDVGESLALQMLVNKATPENLVLKLYSNDKTPAEGDVAGDYTECSGSAYAAKTLTGASWTVSGTNPTSIGYAVQTWTFSGALGAVYGYFMVQASSGTLVYAERFASAPISIANNGEKINLTPAITCT